MRAEEFRIGNIVIAETEDHVLTGYDIYLLSMDDDVGYKPIPLTEDWLVKFGWVWNEACKSFEHPKGARFNMLYRNISGSYTMFNYIINALIAERVFYVHQLQNLYFALTGEELIIK